MLSRVVGKLEDAGLIERRGRRRRPPGRPGRGHRGRRPAAPASCWRNARRCWPSGWPTCPTTIAAVVVAAVPALEALAPNRAPERRADDRSSRLSPARRSRRCDNPNYRRYLGRPVDLADRHLDADDRAVVAGARADPLGDPGRPGRRRADPAGPAARPLRRRDRRPHPTSAG